MIDDEFSQTKERRFQKISSPGGCILQIWDFIRDKICVPGGRILCQNCSQGPVHCPHPPGRTHGNCHRSRLFPQPYDCSLPSDTHGDDGGRSCRELEPGTLPEVVPAHDCVLLFHVRDRVRAKDAGPFLIVRHFLLKNLSIQGNSLSLPASKRSGNGSVLSYRSCSPL
jgi:hypothetical protein